MANVIDKQTIVNSSRNLVVKVVIEGEAAGSDEAATTLVDVSALDSTINHLSLEKIQYDLTGFSVKLLWDATTDDELLDLTGAHSMDFTDFGGIPDPQSTGSTGDVNITTVGLGAAADIGTLVLCFRKHG